MAQRSVYKIGFGNIFEEFCDKLYEESKLYEEKLYVTAGKKSFGTRKFFNNLDKGISWVEAEHGAVVPLAEYNR